MTPSPTKALIIRFSSVGDILLSTLLIRTFRSRFPGCQLDFLVKDQYADLVRYNPNLSNVISFPSGGSLGDLSRLKTTIRSARYDLVIDIHDSLRSRFLTFGHRATVRVNKRKTARFILIKTGVDVYSHFGGAPPVAERYLETVKHLGVSDDQKSFVAEVAELAGETSRNIHTELLREVLEADMPQLHLENFFPEETKTGIESRFGLKTEMVGVAPGSLHKNKMWPADRFAQTAIQIAKEKRMGILLFGSGKDREQCDAIESRVRTEAPEIRVENTAGQTSLLEAAALLDHCAIVLTNDSGLMHLAAARKRKVLAVFGPTVRQFGFFPVGTANVVVEHSGLSCRPCTHIGLETCPRGHFKCMMEVSSETALAATRNLLNS